MYDRTSRPGMVMPICHGTVEGTDCSSNFKSSKYFVCVGCGVWCSLSSALCCLLSAASCSDTQRAQATVSAAQPNADRQYILHPAFHSICSSETQPRRTARCHAAATSVHP